MSRQDKERMLMEDYGWEYDDEGPAVKFDRGGMERAREGDPQWHADLATARSTM